MFTFFNFFNDNLRFRLKVDSERYFFFFESILFRVFYGLHTLRESTHTYTYIIKDKQVNLFHGHNVTTKFLNNVHGGTYDGVKRSFLHPFSCTRECGNRHDYVRIGRHYILHSAHYSHDYTNRRRSDAAMQPPQVRRSPRLRSRGWSHCSSSLPRPPARDLLGLVIAMIYHIIIPQRCVFIPRPHFPPTDPRTKRLRLSAVRARDVRETEEDDRKEKNRKPRRKSRSSRRVSENATGNALVFSVSTSTLCARARHFRDSGQRPLDPVGSLLCVGPQVFLRPDGRTRDRWLSSLVTRPRRAQFDARRPNTTAVYYHRRGRSSRRLFSRPGRSAHRLQDGSHDEFERCPDAAVAQPAPDEHGPRAREILGGIQLPVLRGRDKI